jgi:alpha-glucosidase
MIKIPKMKYCIFYLTLFLITTGCADKKNLGLLSPDGNIRLKLSFNPYKKCGGSPSFSLMSGNKDILLPSSINLKTSKDDEVADFDLIKVERSTITNSWINNFGERKEIPDNYNQVKIYLKNNDLKINLVLRAYNEGVAFSYEFPQQAGKDSLTIYEEKISFRFASDYLSWSAPFAQAQYKHVPLSKIDKGCERPLVVEIDENNTIALAEARLVDYARMKFEPDTTINYSIRSKLDGIVRKKLPFQSPWRVVIVGKNTGDLLEKNYLLLNLNDPSAIEDVSWIKPGKALREVTLTTAGAKAAIDFTSSHKMQYVEFDAGWYGPENNDASDASAVNLDPARSKGPLDMEEVTRYAKSGNIGILLYVNHRALEKQLDKLLPVYQKWGIAGIKFGFVQVGSQEVTSWLHEAIRIVADYKMVADVHDEYRPTGYARTYPNWLTQEGIRGDEESPSNSHTLITMFTRMIAGQGDNTICYYNERVDKKMGSHASQLAKSVCLFSPLQFLYWYDKASPSPEKKDGLWGTTNYIGDEPELEFFDNVPTVWDDTKVLYSKIGEYGVIARKKGNDWFIGGINGESPRTLDINFSFLEPGKKYQAKVYSDDPAIQTRTHVRIDTIEITSETIYKAKLAGNNGIAFHVFLKTD